MIQHLGQIAGSCKIWLYTKVGCNRKKLKVIVLKSKAMDAEGAGTKRLEQLERFGTWVWKLRHRFHGGRYGLYSEKWDWCYHSAEQSLRKKRVRNKRVRKVSENWHNFLERVGWRVLKWYGNVERIREYTLTLNSNQVMIFLIYNDAKAKHSVETILLIYNFSLPRLWCIVQNPIVEQWQWATVSHAITRTNNRYMYANKTSSCV